MSIICLAIRLSAVNKYGLAEKRQTNLVDFWGPSKLQTIFIRVHSMYQKTCLWERKKRKETYFASAAAKNSSRLETK